MQLKAGVPPWNPSPPFAGVFPPLDRDARAEVAVIGGGISGALVAHAMVKAGVPTILIDPRRFAAGSTAASTAMLLYEIDQPLTKLIELRGREHATRAYELCRQAVHRLREIAATLPPEVDFRMRPSMYLAGSRQEADELRAEYVARRACGLKLSLLDAHAIRAMTSFDRPAALLTPEAAECDPVAFTRALLNAAAAKGLQAHEGTEMAICEGAADGCTVRTTRGPIIRANRVVLATGYETKEMIPIDKLKLYSTYAIATNPLPGFPGWPERCLIWEASHPYHYLRTTPEGRVIIGGEDDRVLGPANRDARLPAKAARLARTLRDMFPDMPFEIEYEWAGVFGATPDGLPFIGERRETPGIYYSLGYGGNGITFSALAADLLTQLYLGRTPRDLDIFRFDRPPG